ncbi:hypothetical protein RRG08_005488 [Elysia crispata]|uniref:Uncharacterized protein n=1 Tax=Elysia crispata TaxID=231223 RepID=A0AAE1CQM5_9GAST|nr:hypothetical protein RRG08_005488 [Elysia crispata]
MIDGRAPSACKSFYCSMAAKTQAYHYSADRQRLASLISRWMRLRHCLAHLNGLLDSGSSGAAGISNRPWIRSNLSSRALRSTDVFALH